MEIFTVSALLLVVGLLTWLLIREKSQSAKALEQQAVTLRGAQLRQLDIIEKAFSQLRAADPWQYQAIQSMAAPALYDTEYDPSEEADARRIADRNKTKEDLEEALNAVESAAIDDIFPGSGL